MTILAAAAAAAAAAATAIAFTRTNRVVNLIPHSVCLLH